MTVLKSYDLIRTRADGTDGLSLGRAVQTEQGWRFFPNTTAHKASRKFHPTFDACIPRWTGHPNATRSVLRQKKEA